jgi:Protein of unknown function (DUF2911)
MKKLNMLLFVVFAMAVMACSDSKKENEEKTDEHDHAAATTAEEKPKSKSPAEAAMNNIGDVHVHIEYHSPGVRGRTIFGGLVAFDEVWVTGAHSATTINFPGDVTLNGQEVKKGKYALFTIPGKTEWTFIINKNFEQHLADDYDASLDVVRLTLVPETLTEVQEHLLYEVVSTGGNEGTVSMAWANTMISVNVKSL